MEQGSAIFLIAHARRLHHAVSKHKVILINGDSYLLIGRLTLRLWTNKMSEVFSNGATTWKCCDSCSQYGQI